MQRQHKPKIKITNHETLSSPFTRDYFSSILFNKHLVKINFCAFLRFWWYFVNICIINYSPRTWAKPQWTKVGKSGGRAAAGGEQMTKNVDCWAEALGKFFSFLPNYKLLLFQEDIGVVFLFLWQIKIGKRIDGGFWKGGIGSFDCAEVFGLLLCLRTS